jgi:serine/threonine protein kinase
MLQNLKHLNFVKFYGVCLKHEKIHYLILEYMNKGDLHNYLLIKNKLDICEIILITIQIADACEYLEENKIVHRDLAARNCLLSSINGTNCSNKLVVKIADFGLARNLDSDNIYKLKCFNQLPVRWMAPESILKGLFTVKSDVW